jgi:hypothetical protein
MNATYDQEYCIDFSNIQVRQDGSVTLTSEISYLKALTKLVDLTEKEWGILNATKISMRFDITGLLYRRIKQ